MAVPCSSVSDSVNVSWNDIQNIANNYKQLTKTKKLTINNIELTVELSANNEEKEDVYIQFQIILNKSPSNVKLVILFYRIYCQPSRTLFKQSGILIKKKDKIKWPSHQLALSEFTDKHNCKFNYDLELLQIKYNKDSLLGGLVGKKRSIDEQKLFRYRQLATTSRVKFEWNINDQVMQLFKIAKCGKSYSSIDVNNIWCLCCYPNGNEIQYEGHLLLSLKLLRLPPNVRTVDVNLKFETKGKNINVRPYQRENISFNYIDYEHVWYDPFFPTESLWSKDCNRLTFAVSIEIQKIYQDVGKNNQQNKGKEIKPHEWSDFHIDTEYLPQMSGEIDDGYDYKETSPNTHHKSLSQPQLIRKETERDKYLKVHSQSEDFNWFFQTHQIYNESTNDIIPEDNELSPAYEMIEGKNDCVIQLNDIYKHKFRQWICNKVKLKKYLLLFEQSGEFDVRRIRMFNDSILQKIGIEKVTDRKLILEEAENFVKLKSEFDRLLQTHQVLHPYKEILKENGIFISSDFQNDILNKSQLKEMLKESCDDRIDEIWDILHPSEADMIIKQEIEQLKQQKMRVEKDMNEYIQNLQRMQTKMAPIKIISRNQKHAKQQHTKMIIDYDYVLKNHQDLLEPMKQLIEKTNQETIIEEKHNINIDVSEIRFKEWLLTKAHLGQHFSLFKEYGCVKIERVKYFDDNELKDVGILNQDHRKRFLKRANELKQSQQKFKQMIKQNKVLLQFKEQFKSNSILTIDDLRNSIQTTNDIQKVLGLSNTDGRMQSILNAIKQKTQRENTIPNKNSSKSILLPVIKDSSSNPVQSISATKTIIVSDIKKFRSKLNGEKSSSEAIIVNDVLFRVDLYPNGQLQRNAQQNGYVQFNINIFVSNLAKNDIRAMVILCRLYCKQTKSFFKEVKIFSKEKSSIGWPMHQLKLSKCALYKTLEFVCCMELLHVKYTYDDNNSIFGGLFNRNSLNPDNVFQYKEISTRSVTEFTWKLSKSDLKLFQKASTGESFCCADVDEMWSLRCYPNGDTEYNTGHFVLLLQLMRLPAHIISIDADVDVDIYCKDKPKYEKQNIGFNYNQLAHRFWSSTNIIPHWSLHRMKKLQFVVSIVIKKIFEDKTNKKGREVKRENWHEYGLQHMCIPKIINGIDNCGDDYTHRNTQSKEIINDSETEEKSLYSTENQLLRTSDAQSITPFPSMHRNTLTPFNMNRPSNSSSVRTSIDTNITPTLTPQNRKLEESTLTHCQSNEMSNNIHTLILNQTLHGIHIEDECRLYKVDDIFNCGIIGELYKYLQEYQINYDSFEKLYGDQTTQILNMYHHVIRIHHNQQDFDQMYDIMSNKMPCYISGCSIIMRADKFNGTINGIMDMIHIVLYHSYHLGYRKRIDIDIAPSFKKNWIKKIRNTAFSHNKFKTNDDKDRNNYAFGVEYYYWNEYKYEEKFIPMGKHKSLKDEIKNNYLDIKKFNDIHTKAKQLLVTQYAKKRKVTVEKYGLSFDMKLKLENIMVIYMYCHNSQLSYNFSTTFRRLRKNESLSEMKERNRKYWWMSKLLRETVECYGDKMINVSIKQYYHGVSERCIFDLFIVRLNGPISTTANYGIATIFGGNNGIIVELTEYEPDLTCFNCEFISPFPAEEERLFFGGNGMMQITGLTLLNNLNPPEHYSIEVKAIRNFHCFLRGSELREEYDYDPYDESDGDDEKKEIKRMPIAKINKSSSGVRNKERYEQENQIMKTISLKKIHNVYKEDILKEKKMEIWYKEAINKFAEMQLKKEYKVKKIYINEVFGAFCKRRKRICINIEEMYSIYSSFSDIFGGLDLKNILKLDKMTMIFPNCCKITIECGGIYREINTKYIDMLLNMLKKVNNSKLKCIEIIKINCNMNTNIFSLEFDSKFRSIGWEILY
eukprot:462542_1